MSNLYIHTCPVWINYVHADDVDSILDDYQGMGKEVVFGDYALWSRQVRKKFLIFIENNEGVSIFSSVNMEDGVFLSRFKSIYITPLQHMLSDTLVTYRDIQGTSLIGASLQKLKNTPLQGLL